MAKQLEDLWDNVPGFDSNNGEFKRLDLDRWLKEKKIIEIAKTDGQQNKPSAEEARSGIPDKIIAWVNSRGRTCRQNVSGWLADLMRNLTDMEDSEGLERQKQEVEETLENAKLDLESKVREQRNHIATLQQSVRDARNDYEEFRREAKLRRLPDYSVRKSALTYILFFFSLELVLNATSLMDANPFGLLGAIVQMALICAVNILIMGWWVGGLLRLMHHVSFPIKAMAGFAAFVATILVIGFNLAVGHFRDSMQAILDDPEADILAVGSDTFVRLSEGLVAFDSFQSALLALLGILFFCVSTWKWLDRDDRYPGYGKKHRLLKEIQDDYIERFDRATAELRAEFKDYESKLKDVLHRLVTQQERWRRNGIQGQQVVSDFSTNLKQYQHDLNELLGAYFRENRAARTEPEPAWFSQEVKVDKEILDPPEFKLPKQPSFKEVADVVDQAIKELQQFYGKKRQEFPNLEEAMHNTSDSREQTG